MNDLNTKAHVALLGSHTYSFDEEPEDPRRLRRDIEPWLGNVLESEHLGLLIGNGFVISTAQQLGVAAAGMESPSFASGLEFREKVMRESERRAKLVGRNTPNFEDVLHAATLLHQGLEIQEHPSANQWHQALDDVLEQFASDILGGERAIAKALKSQGSAAREAKHIVCSFLLSFASRSASRERLQIFTTNYDRLVEKVCDLLGLHVLDRFVGFLEPEFHSSRLDVDFHYNPPGIRGEPRYLEGVVRLAKLHGSVDWVADSGAIRRAALAFGAAKPELPTGALDCLMVYPNSAKDVETLEYPYVEIFRDFSAAACRPNSTLVCYGYGFGDDHINRVVADMLTITSTHLVIISYDDAGGRVSSFVKKHAKPGRVTVLMGSHFGDLRTLVSHYLPKPALDVLAARSDLQETEGRSENTPGDGEGRSDAVVTDSTA